MARQIVENKSMWSPRRFTLYALSTALVLSAPLSSFGAKKVASPNTSAANDDVEISATITLAEPDVAQKLGVDPGKGIVLVEVRLSPKTEKGLRVSPDDFILLSHDDGQRSQPFQPEQLAGKGGLVLGRGTTGGGGGLSRTPGAPIGTSPTGRVQRMPGGGNGVGNMGGGAETVKTETNKDDKGNSALLNVLKEKQLPDSTATDEVSGYLYFPLEGKHKLKNMALLYRGQGGHLDLEFEH